MLARLSEKSSPPPAPGRSLSGVSPGSDRETPGSARTSRERSSSRYSSLTSVARQASTRTPASCVTAAKHGSLWTLSSHAIALGFLGIAVNAVLFCGMILKLLGWEDASWRLGCWTADGLWGYIQDHMESTLGGKGVNTFSGDLDEVEVGEGAIVIANHQGYIDYYLIHALAQRLPLTPSSCTPHHTHVGSIATTTTADDDVYVSQGESQKEEKFGRVDRRVDRLARGRGMLGSCRYFAKKSLVWQVPVFGWSMWAIGMILVSRDWTTDAELIKSTFRRIKENRHPCWIVSYLEGTRLSRRKILESTRYAEAQGKPRYERVLFPRTKGFVTTVQELRGSHIKYIYDLTLCYRSPSLATHAAAPKLSAASERSYGTDDVSGASETTRRRADQARDLLAGPTRAPGLVELLSEKDLCRAGYAFHVDMRRIEIDSLPQDEEGLKAWVEDAWSAKDRFLRDRAER